MNHSSKTTGCWNYPVESCCESNETSPNKINFNSSSHVGQTDRDSVRKSHLLATLIASFFLFFGGFISAQTVTFTNAGASGRLGPTQAQVNSAYSGTSLEGNVTVNTQGIQEWIVPSTGTYTIEAWGAGGAQANAKGAKLKGDFELAQGTKLFIAVGQQAPGNAGGNGGTFVASGTQLSNTSPLIVAGGGGGLNNAAYSNAVGNAVFGTTGNQGNTGYGGSDGNGGQTNTNNTFYGGGGGGGFYSNGVNTSGYGIVGEGFRNGARGGVTTSSQANVEGGFGGGGSGYTSDEPAGGGGYSGGGGGGHAGQSNTGMGGNRIGGGGGSFNAGTTPENIAINNTGHGKVVISQPQVAGCINEEACNFDPLAVVDDGSCILNLDCAGVCGGSSITNECGDCYDPDDLFEGSFTFNYTGSQQSFTAPVTGVYTIETWGAKGGDITTHHPQAGAPGGYVKGDIELTTGETILIYVGGKGADRLGNHPYAGCTEVQGGWNGGGKTRSAGTSTPGGGATDVRKGGNTLADRIIVAGGGGGGGWTYAAGGAGGGLIGGNGTKSNGNNTGAFGGS